MHPKRIIIIKSSLLLVYASLILMLMMDYVSIVDSAERVNCRRVIFHPYCRGISAKRSSPPTSLPLKEAPEIQSNVDDVRKSMQKAWHGQLFADLRQRILENYNRQQTLFQPMTAIIIDDNNPNQSDMEERDEYVFVDDDLSASPSDPNNLSDEDSNNNIDQIGQSSMFDLSRFNNGVRPPPYMLDIQTIGKSIDEPKINQNDGRKNRALPLIDHRGMFQARMVSYPEFIRMFPQMHQQFLGQF